MSKAESIFTEKWTKEVFPESKTEDFFDALFGGSEEGAYDISLSFKGAKEQELEFSFDLTQRPGKCLACNLTYGLPEVFSRHPIINAKGIASEVAKALDKDEKDLSWRLLNTREESSELHSVPFIITIN